MLTEPQLPAPSAPSNNHPIMGSCRLRREGVLGCQLLSLSPRPSQPPTHCPSVTEDGRGPRLVFQAATLSPRPLCTSIRPEPCLVHGGRGTRPGRSQRSHSHGAQPLPRPQRPTWALPDLATGRRGARAGPAGLGTHLAMRAPARPGRQRGLWILTLKVAQGAEAVGPREHLRNAPFRARPLRDRICT